MNHLTCDLCGKPLLVGEPVRYEARIQVYAAYDPLELTPDDLERSHRAEICALLKELEQLDPKQVEDSVFKEFLFDLCMACQRRYLSDPLRRQEAGARPLAGERCPDPPAAPASPST